jgi:hypothetical protein
MTGNHDRERQLQLPQGPFLHVIEELTSRKQRELTSRKWKERVFS